MPTVVVFLFIQYLNNDYMYMFAFFVIDVLPQMFIAANKSTL